MIKKALLIFLIICSLGILLMLGYFILQKQYVKQPSDQLVKFAIGNIDKLENNQITIAVKKPSLKSSTPETSYLKFILDEKTKYYGYSNEIKNQADFIEEQKIYNNLINQVVSEKKDITSLEAPSWYKINKLIISDLKVGEIVSVYLSQTDKNNTLSLAKKIIVEKNNMVNLNMGNSVFQADGVINEIQKNKIILKINASPVKDLAIASSGDITEYNLANDCLFFRSSLKSSLQFKIEQDQYNKKLADLASQGMINYKLLPPSWYVLYKIDFKNITIGSRVRINGVKDESGQMIAKVIILE